MPVLMQPSFSAGEIAPAAYARVDLAKYYTALRTCRNFVVLPEGGVQNRAGTRYIVGVKDSSVYTRLIPFQFSTDQTYILEFGDRYIRFITGGGQVVSGSNIYEISTPYRTADLRELKFTQSADVLTIVHPGYAPRDLKRLGPTNWTLTTISFSPDLAAPSNLTAAARGTGTKVTEYQYKITAVSSPANDSVESVASNTATVNSDDDLPGAKLNWTAVTGADHYNVYKNKSSGIFGFIGQATGTSFTDVNITPDSDKTVPIANNPFEGNNFPSVVGYFQQRLVFGASNAKPQTLWMSRTGDFHNFSYSDPTRDDDSIEVTFATNQVNKIRHLVSLRELLALTSGAEFSITGSSDSGITPDSVSINPQSYFGANSVLPAVYANTALYVQSRGGKLATLAYNYVSDGFQPQDVSVLSSHLLRGFSIQDMAFTLAPNGVLWMVRNDGALIGFTFMPDQQVFAWHRHDTDGQVESVASVPEGDEDILYLIVRRTINGATKRYIERMATRQLVKSQSGDYPFDRSFFVDCGLTYDGRRTGTATLIGGTDWKYPNPLTLNISSTEFNASMVGRSVILYGGGDDTRIGDVLVAKITNYNTSRQVQVVPETLVPESLRGVAATRWGIAATTVSGLGHIEGKTVSILADGNVLPVNTVSGGSVVIGDPVLVAHIGLPYTSDFETLDVTLQNNQTFLANKKRINQIDVLVQESRGIFAGSDADHLYEFKQRSTENYGEPIDLLTGRAEISVSARWDTEGRMFIRQTDPLPLTILGVMPNVQAGG